MLLVTGDDFLEIPAEVLIQRDSRLSSLRLLENLDDGPAAAMRRSNYRNRTVVFTLNNYLHRLPGLC
jgi:hypothetical protein